MNKLVYLHDSVHKDQLRALLKDCGFQVTPKTFRDLHRDDAGRYAGTLFRIVDGKAVGLSPGEAEWHMMDPDRVHLHEVLGPKVITNAQITRTHPVTGKAAPDGGAYLTADIHGYPMTVMPLGKTLADQFFRGQRDAVEIASGIFSDALVRFRRQVRIEVDHGARWTDGTHTAYYGGTLPDGSRCYKDLAAFDEKEGICFISDAHLKEYNLDLMARKEIDIDSYGDRYEDIIGYARTLAIRNPEEVARHCLQNASWQSVFTELEEFHNNCEAEDILELDEKIQDLYDLYVQKNGMAPNYAEVYIEYKDSGEGQRDMIALNRKAGEVADDEVVFTCESFGGFKRLAGEDNGEDFKVCEIYAYHAGPMVNEQQVETTDEAVDTSYSRIIYMDTRVTSKIKESMRDKGPDRITDSIDSMGDGSTIYETEESASLSLDDITDVRIFRNPQNKSEVEFRMRCKIDGVQQMGKRLDVSQVEELANGGDRTQMAAKVFAKELAEMSADRTRGRGVTL